MKSFLMTEEFVTGIAQIDKQHADLLALIQRAYMLEKDENMLFKCADINKILTRLNTDMLTHFSYEEEYMRKIGYVGLESHVKQHQEFQEKLEDFIARVPKLSLDTQDQLTGELFQYLHSWWLGHIKNVDMEYVEFSRKVSEG